MTHQFFVLFFIHELLDTAGKNKNKLGLTHCLGNVVSVFLICHCFISRHSNRGDNMKSFKSITPLLAHTTPWEITEEQIVFSPCRQPSRPAARKASRAGRRTLSNWRRSSRPQPLDTGDPSEPGSGPRTACPPGSGAG